MANIETGDSIEYGSRLKTRSSNVNSFGLFFVIRPFLFYQRVRNFYSFFVDVFPEAGIMKLR